MQDEINEKVVALSVKGAKLTAEMLQKAIKTMACTGKKAAGKTAPRETDAKAACEAERGAFQH